MINYFSLFGLPVSYKINMKFLSLSFYNLQRKYHPDKFVNASEEEKLFATKQSAMLNQAWNTLRNPLFRAEYLLSIQGFNLSSGEHKVEDSFLNYLFSLREEIDELKFIYNKEKFETLIKRINRMLKVYYQQMEIEFDNKNWKTAIIFVYKLRFLNELINSLEKLRKDIYPNYIIKSLL